MPFIDLNALNPLSNKKDDQGQTIQATDDQGTAVTAVNPATQLPDTDPVQQVVADTAAALPPQVSDAQVSAELIVPEVPVLDLTVDQAIPVAQEVAPVEIFESQVEVQPIIEAVVPVEAIMQSSLPEPTTSASPNGLTVPQPVDLASPMSNDDGVELHASSSSEEQNMDKSGNPIPAISVDGGDVQTDESGMREIKGPDFTNSETSQPSEINQLETQDLNAKLDAIQVEDQIMAAPEVVVEPVLEVPATDVLAAEAVDSTAEVEIQPVTPSPTVIPEVTPIADLSETPIQDLQPVVQNEQELAASPIEDNPTEVVVNEGQPVALPELGEEGKKYTIEELLDQSISMGASDLHLTAGYRAMVRVDGALQQVQSQILTDQSIKDLIKPVLATIKMDTVKEIRDLDLAYQSKDGTRFRVNVFQQQMTQSAVFRVIPSRIQTVEELGLPEKLREFTQMSQGLVLVTGPTGSGKSTSLAAMVNEINMKDPRHIVTIEDPIEFVYPRGVALVDQRGIRQDTDSWDNALRSILRQDPDVVLIGEMRDLETISAALHIAETGHLVFGTLHTNSAAQSIDRMIDVFPKEQQAQIRTQLASVLKAIVSQRLVPLKTGGRRVSIEIMIATPAVANSIRSSKVYQIDNIIQTSGDLGMISMEKSLVNLVKNNVITTEQAQFYANRPDEVLSLLGKKQ